MLGPTGPVEEEVAHGRDNVVVLRLGVGHPRRQPDMGGDDRCSGRGADVQIVGVGKAADVVAHDGAHGIGLARHLGAPRVH